MKVADKPTCTSCGGTIDVWQVPGEGHACASVRFTAAELQQLARDTMDLRVCARALVALGLLDPAKERETRAMVTTETELIEVVHREPLCVLHVDGMPQTKGSWRVRMHRGRPSLVPDNDAEPAWASAVGWSAKAQLRGRQPDAQRYAVSIAFTLIPPPNKRKTNRRDLDKLARSVLDALTGIVWLDDEQVEDLTLTKAVGPVAGAVITIEAKEPTT